MPNKTIINYPQAFSAVNWQRFPFANLASVVEPVFRLRREGVRVCIQAIRRLIRLEYEDMLEEYEERLERIGLELNEDELICLVSESLGAPDIALDLSIELGRIFEKTEAHPTEKLALRFFTESLENLLDDYSEKLADLLERAEGELLWGIEYQSGVYASCVDYMTDYDLQYDIAA